MNRKTYTITGTVQGVGFRPTLFRLAREAGLGGWIQNRSGSVALTLEGASDTIDAFVARLPSAIPKNATISNITLVDEISLTTTIVSPFHINESGFDTQSSVTIPADLAMCHECREDVLDPNNRRYQYPFTTCTTCGPRYTVVHGMPYDRSRTTLNAFPLCEACEKEYRDPSNRRFHAESTACPKCGPKLWFTPSSKSPLPPALLPPIPAARNLLVDGGILAIRGMGGFHLAVDATNTTAIAELRRRKHRPDKPFAVMARNLDAIRQVCQLSPTEADLLKSPEAPIVILNLKPQTATSPQSTAHSPLPVSHISPDTRTLGVMLPTTPLHLLLHEGVNDDYIPPFEFLIMTSGNQNAEPICIQNEEAQTRLSSIADAFLLHDREINLRCDDSLCIDQPSGLQVWRRARGYAPNPILIPQSLSCCVLAMGAELKNAIAIGFSSQVTLSPHIGDLSTPKARDAHERVTKELPEFLDHPPQLIAVDHHPDMHCTRHGETIAKTLGIPTLSVQHHHAHGAACLAENGSTFGLALVLDGTGLGWDGNIWGAELLHIEGSQFARLATFSPVPLPGGDKAVAEPNRQLVARWHVAGITPEPELLQRCGIQEDQNRVWKQQCSQRINAPLTHAAGRLFDSFSALLGTAPSRTSYEGQAPIRLEAAAQQSRSTATLPFNSIEQDRLLSIDWSPAFAELTKRHADIWQRPDAAKQIHNAVAEAAVSMVRYGIERTGETTIALSGGVFMNRLLCSLLIPKLEALGLTVLTHSITPPNDGCIALGQAVVAGWKIASD